MSGGQDSRDTIQAPGDDEDHGDGEAAPASSPPSSSDGPTWAPDLDGLLCALVLAPGTYSRNRFFRMFENAGARRVRRRATHVRSVLRSLREKGDLTGVLPEVDTATLAADIEIAFHVASLGLTRTARLAPIELSLVRYALKVGSDDVRARDKSRVEGALARLAPV